jgi:hypothetical protein
MVMKWIIALAPMYMLDTYLTLCIEGHFQQGDFKNGFWVKNEVEDS